MQGTRLCAFLVAIEHTLNGAEGNGQGKVLVKLGDVWLPSLFHCMGLSAASHLQSGPVQTPVIPQAALSEEGQILGAWEE